MSISTLESPATVRALDAQHAASDERERTESYLRAAFLKAAASCNAQAFAPFAGMVRDWNDKDPRAKRLQTVGEILHDELQHGDFADRAMTVLMVAARSMPQAQKLLEEMAAQWASMEVTL
jgi:hypothetical protein